MIYTTYFAKLNKLPSNIIPIAICGKSPDGYIGLEYKKLAPKYSFFSEWKKNQDNDYYIRHFNEEVLGVLDADKVAFELAELTYGAKDIALVCYERPDAFCHRHIVAQWLRDNGYECEEYKFN